MTTNLNQEIDYSSFEWKKFEKDINQLFFSSCNSLNDVTEYAYHYARGQIKEFLLGRLEVLKKELEFEYKRLEVFPPGDFEREKQWEVINQMGSDLKIITEFIEQTIKTLEV